MGETSGCEETLFGPHGHFEDYVASGVIHTCFEATTPHFAPSGSLTQPLQAVSLMAGCAGGGALCTGLQPA